MASTTKQRQVPGASAKRQVQPSTVDLSKVPNPQDRLDLVLRGEIGFSDLGNNYQDERIKRVFESGRYGDPEKYRRANPEIMRKYKENQEKAKIRQAYSKAYTEQTDEIRREYIKRLDVLNNTIESEKLYAMNVLGLDPQEADVYAYMKFNTKLSEREIQDYLRDGNPATSGINGFINSFNKGIGMITEIAQIAFNPIKAIEDGLASTAKEQGVGLIKEELISDMAELLGDEGMTRELFRIDKLRKINGIPVYDEQLYGVQTDALDRAYRKELNQIAKEVRKEQGIE